MIRKFIFALFVLFISINLMAVELIFICEDAEDFPYVLGSGSEIQADKPGAAVEMLRILEEKLDIKITIQRFPWRRALEVELRQGNADGLFYASYRKDREEFGVYPTIDGEVDPSKALFTLSYYFYQLKDSPVSWDGENLKDFSGRVGAPRGYSIVRDLEGKGLTVDESATTLLDMQRLQLKRVDVIAALEAQGDNVLANHPELAELIERVEPAISSSDYYLLLSHKFVEENPELAQKIWETIAEIRDNDLAGILEKY